MSDNKRPRKRIVLIVLVSSLAVLVFTLVYTIVFTVTRGADYPGGPPTRNPT